MFYWLFDTLTGMMVFMLGIPAIILGLAFAIGVVLEESDTGPEECAAMGGKFVNGGQHGDDFCVGNDGRIVKVY